MQSDSVYALIFAKQKFKHRRWHEFWVLIVFKPFRYTLKSVMEKG